MLSMPINWMQFAQSMSSINPGAPVIIADGSIYSPDGRLLAPGTATLDLTGPAPPRDSRRARRPVPAARCQAAASFS